MDVLVRRFLVLAALIFWQGGFVFYGSVVVPVARAVLDPPSLQAPITSRVTNVQNAAGAVALLVFAWDLWRPPKLPGRSARFRGAAWFLMLLTLVILAGVHVRLDEQMARGDADILRDPTFYAAHRVYLWVGAVQCLCCVWFTWVTLRVWREEDCGSRREGE